MVRCHWLCWITLLLCVVGCRKNSSSGSEGPEFPTDPAAQAAYDFLDAVLKGDSQRASQRLSPLAMQRIVESGKQFAPPGLESASFHIGEVRQPPGSPSQALVQCLLTDASPSGEKRREEMCCLMRLVEGQWCVSGIAYSTGPNRPPMILDFENPPRRSSPTQPMAEAGGQSPPGQVDRPTSTPRTARDPAYPVAR